MCFSRYLRLCMAVVGLVLLSSVATAAPTAHATTATAALPTYTLTRTTPAFPTPTLAEALKAAAPACQRTLHPNVTPDFSLTFAAYDATHTPITTVSFTLPTLPYTITYTVTVTNTSAAPTPATTLALSFGDFYAFITLNKGLKAVNHKIPTLAPGASRTFSVKHTYTSGAYTVIAGTLDPHCQQNFVHPTPMASMTLVPLAPTADIVPVGIRVVSQKGFGTLYSADTFAVTITLANFGLTNPTADVPVRVASPLLGTATTAIVTVADLPTAASPGSYTLSDSMGTPLIFTAKTVTKPVRVPLTATLTLPTGDTSKAKTRSTNAAITLLPNGIDLTPWIGTTDCPIRVGASEAVDILVTNYGSYSATFPFAIHLHVDGKASGAPTTVPGLNGDDTFDLQTTVTFTKAGKHTLSVVVDPAKNADYSPSNNKVTISRYVLP